MIPDKIKEYYPTNVGLRSIAHKDNMIVWVFKGKELVSVDHWIAFMDDWEKCEKKRHA